VGAFPDLARLDFRRLRARQRRFGFLDLGLALSGSGLFRRGGGGFGAFPLPITARRSLTRRREVDTASGGFASGGFAALTRSPCGGLSGLV